MTQGRTKIIACRTVIEEIQHLLPSDMEALTLDSGLHLHPERLRGGLQAMIDGITAHTETIILGYGLCAPLLKPEQAGMQDFLISSQRPLPERGGAYVQGA